MSIYHGHELQEDLSLLLRPGEGHVLFPVAGALAVGLGLLVVAGAVLLWRRRRCPQAVAPDDAGDTALRALHQWQGLSDHARYRAAVADISGIVRRFVEARFGVHAPRLTTEQFWDQIRAQRRLSSEFGPFWEQFLAAADWVKYAGYDPTTQEFLRLHAAATQFVQAASTRP